MTIVDVGRYVDSRWRCHEGCGRPATHLLVDEAGEILSFGCRAAAENIRDGLRSGAMSR